MYAAVSPSIEERVLSRFLPQSTRQADDYLGAARRYMSKMSGFELEWLYRKPYDPRPGNEQFFLQVYAVMNLIKAMDIPRAGRVLEVGSGPGWVSELLMLLGYEVDGIEPCEELIAVARQRIEDAARHYHISRPPRVEFHLTTMEASELTPEVFDAVARFVDETDPFDVQITVLTPFPGTPLYARLLAEGRILEPGAWEKATLFDVNHQPADMTVAELEEGLVELGRYIYSQECTDRRRAGFKRQVAAGMHRPALRRAAS